MGFHAIVLDAIVAEGCYISPTALVTGGVKIRSNRFIPAGVIIDTQEKADALGPVPKSQIEFAKEVQYVNQKFPNAYSLQFGGHEMQLWFSIGLQDHQRCAGLKRFTLRYVRIAESVFM